MNWRYFSADPKTKYYKADGKTPIAHDECFTDAGTSLGPGSWSEWSANCKTPDNWNGDPNIKAWDEGNSPESFAAATWTLPEFLTPGKYVFRWIWYGGASMDGTILSVASKGTKGEEPALFANCVDVTVKPKRSPSPSPSTDKIAKQSSDPFERH